MATSDNVVRAGLTPKPKDVETLVSMLTYNSFSPADICTSGRVLDRHSTLYETPIPEFDLICISVASGECYESKPVHGPSLLLIVEGQGRLNGINCPAGTVLFLQPDEPLAIDSIADAVKLFRAFTVLS
jgi:mannose-6-phosphate isomerase